MVQQTGWNPFKYEKGKKYYDLLSSDYYENQTWGALTQVLARNYDSQKQA